MATQPLIARVLWHTRRMGGFVRGTCHQIPRPSLNAMQTVHVVWVVLTVGPSVTVTSLCSAVFKLVERTMASLRMNASERDGMLVSMLGKSSPVSRPKKGQGVW